MPASDLLAACPQDIGPISVDFETYDPGLSDSGTDAYACRKDAFPFSLAIWTPDPAYQFVVRREDPYWLQTIDWIREGIKEGGCHFIGANIKYELAWLHWLDVWGTPDTPAAEVLARNRWSDVLVRAALIDSTDRKKLHLEGQAHLYRLEPKGTEALYAEAIKMGLGTEKRPPKKQTVYENLWKMPAGIVSEYNLLDAQLAYEIYHRQTPILEAEGLEKVAEMEERLTPVLAAMESKGLRIDLEALDRLEEDLTRRIRATQERVDRQAGEPVSPNPSHSLARALAHIPLPKTATGKPKTDAKTLKRYIDAAPIVGDILDLRRLSKILGTFVQGAIRENLSGDRIYCTLNQLASDSYGVVYGRLSCSNPNGQQIPKRDEEFGPLMRGLFIPEPGFQFLAADYSKQEPRMSAHLAVTWNVPGAKAIADAFKANPDLDVHSYVASLANLTGILGDKLGYLAGKTCLATGTRIATNKGWVSIEKLSEDMLVWDGESFVPYQGIICKDLQETITYAGITGTPDHGVFVSEKERVPFGYIASGIYPGRVASTGIEKTGFLFNPWREDIYRQEKAQNGFDDLYILREEAREVCGQYPSREGKLPLPEAEEIQPSASEAVREKVSRGSWEVYETDTQVLRELWRAWYTDAFCFVSAVYKLYSGKFAMRRLHSVGYRQARQRGGLHAWEPSPRLSETEFKQYASECLLQLPRDGCCSLSFMAFTKNGFPRFSIIPGANTKISFSWGLFREHFEGKTEKKVVWDIANCGPRHRFTIPGFLVANCNLAISYGQQEKSTQASLLALGVPEEVLSQVTAAYHQAYPHVRGCMELFQRIAEKNGFVRTILGRKQRFDGWVPRGYVNHGPKDKNGRPAPLPWEEAKAVYRVEELGLVLVRAKTYAAFNYANQGSAADQTKLAMNALFYDHGIVPNLQVHDELIDGEGTPEKAEIYKKVMEEVVELAVPVRVEVTLGASWAG